MSDELIYEITRTTDAATDAALINRFQLLRADDGLVVRADIGPDARLAANDALAAISSDPRLHDIYAEQETTITADPEIAAELPFILRARFADPDVESAPLDHVNADDWLVQVNDAQWAPFLTTQHRYAMLPTDWNEVDLATTWATMQFIETGSMVSGADRTSIGLATASAVVAITRLDPSVDSPRYPVVVSRRGQTADDDAELIADWVSGNNLSNYLDLDTRMLVRLFAATATDPDGRQVWFGDYLSLDTSSKESVGGTPSSEWLLALDIPRDVTESALDAIAAISAEFANIVTAARIPESPAGRAWKELLSENGL